MSHLLGTCAIALEHGASEDQAIAALFHDAIEDVEPTDEVRATIRRFGEEVLRIVEACTDCDERPTPPWRECKERYLAAVPGHDRTSLLVSASDKLHNARRLVELLRRDGPAAWDRFEDGGADRLWYYRALVTVYRANPGHDVGAHRRARPDGHRDGAHRRGRVGAALDRRATVVVRARLLRGLQRRTMRWNS